MAHIKSRDIDQMNPEQRERRMHLPRNSKRTTESNHFNSKKEVWKDGNNGRRNR